MAPMTDKQLPPIGVHRLETCDEAAKENYSAAANKDNSDISGNAPIETVESIKPVDVPVPQSNGVAVSETAVAAAASVAEKKPEEKKFISCFRSGGSICIPRTPSHNANSFLPKLPDGDTSARDELRQRLKFGFTKVKAANRLKKAGSANNPPKSPKPPTKSEEKSKASATVALATAAAGVATSIVKKEKKDREVILPELKSATIQEVEKEEFCSLGNSVLAKETANFCPKGGLYGVVEFLTETGGAIFKISKATKPKIRLGTGFVEEKDPFLIEKNRDAQSHDALERSRLDEDGLRCSFDEALKLRNLQEAINERRQARAFRRSSREEVATVATRRRSLIADQLERDPPPKAGKCRKHSRCHCFLFSLDNLEYHAVGENGEQEGH